MLTYIPTNCLHLFTHNLNTYDAFTYTFCLHFIYICTVCFCPLNAFDHIVYMLYMYINSLYMWIVYL